MPAPEEALSAGNITFTGYEGAAINAYQALPAGDGPFAGVLVIHHLPGWDSGDQGDHPSLRRGGLQRDLPQPLRPPGTRCRSRRRRGRHPRGRWHPRRPVRGRRRGRRRGPAGPPHLQRQGRRHRLLLGRPPLLPHRGERARRCGGRLLRGLRDRDRARRLPAQGDAAGRPDPAISRARCSASSATTTSSPAPSRSTSWRRRSRPRARRTSSTATTAPATRSSRWTGRPTGPRRRSTAGSASSSGTAATWRGADHVLLPHRRHRDRRQRQGSAGLVPGHLGAASTSTTRSTRRSTTRSTSTSPTRREGPAPASPSSSARRRPAGSSRASTRRWPPRGPPPRDRHPPARRPASTCPGPRCPTRCGRGRPASAAARRRPPATSRRVLAGCDHACSTAHGGAIFVKAVGAALNPESPDLHRREAVVSAALPSGPEFPRLLDVYDDGDWVALAFEAIDGRPPAHPWDARELASAVRRARCPARRAHAQPGAGRRRPRPTGCAHLFGGWAELAAMARPPDGLDAWSGRNLGRLAELEAGWPDAVAGPTLVHGDVRSDNLLVTSSGGVVFVDWPHAGVGAPVFDLVAWAPSVVLEGGPAPEELLALPRPCLRGRPRRPGRPARRLQRLLGAHSLRPPPPGLPTLRPFQAAQGAVALAWLRRLTGW